MTMVAPSLWQRLRYTRIRDAIRGRFDASLDWRLVLAEAELPADVTRVIEQVVHGTRLWRSEKLSVAGELVAHFQDGHAAGRSSEELVASFGDPQQTARLIRRAKRRGRSVLWHLWRFALIAVGLLLLIYILAGLWMVLDRPSVKTDYLAIVNERALSVPEQERAWPLYREALLALGAAGTHPDDSAPFTAATQSKPGDANWTATQEFLEKHTNELKQLREAASRSGLGFEGKTSIAALDAADRKLFGMEVTADQIEAAKQQKVEDRWLIGTLLPHVQYLKSAALLLANDARRAALKGDGGTAFEDVVAIYGMGHHLEEMPFLVSLLVGEMLHQQARMAIQDIARDQPELWSNDQLRDLAHRTAAAQIDWRHAFEGERASFYDSMQHVYTDDGNGDGRLALSVTEDANLFEMLASVTDTSTSGSLLDDGFFAMMAMPAANMLVASRKEMIEMYDRYADRALDKLETPYWESRNDRSIDERLEEMSEGPIGKFRYLFINLLLPAFDAVKVRYVTSQGQREGVLIGLALELYHREHKKWPESLAELSPQYLPEVFVDRITGEPLLLKIVDDRPVVYSRGVDSDDDGGRMPEYFAQNDYEYPVGPAYELDSNATETMREQHDGDWALWSMKDQ